jgi:hypothetical protein
VSVGDVDVVIEPGEANLQRLREALSGLAVRPRDVPAAHRLREISVATVCSSYGRVDCMLERGRRDWTRLRAAAGHVAVADKPRSFYITRSFGAKPSPTVKTAPATP